MSKSKARSCYELARHENGDPHSTCNLPLTPEMKETAISSIERLSEIYPRNENGAPGVRPGGGGVSPTVALQRSITAIE